MRKLFYPRTPLLLCARIFPTIVATLTLLLASAHLGISQSGAQVEIYSGQATISTANCNSATTTPPGLCQAAPSCNNGAGPNPDTIQATVTLCEVGARVATEPPLAVVIPRGSGTLTVRGYGTGFRPGGTYVSLLYLNGATSTCSRFPAGVTPTLQNLFQADSDFASMHLGFWVVQPNGTATLTIDKEATVSGLINYKTVSVREMQPPNATCYNCGLDPAPQLNALRACGALTVTAATSCTLP
jgi:hypothetical protein